MKFSSVFRAVPLLSSLLFPVVSAQTGAYYTDADTGIKFWQYTIPTAQTTGGFQFGLALPGEAGGTNDEYIGHLVGSRQDGAGWSGISHGGGMTSALLLLAWVDGETIKTSFRYASGYTTPEIYTGNATLSEISHSINETHFSLIYRCQWCWAWDHNGATGAQLPTGQVEVIGWVQANDSPSPVDDAAGTIVQHDNGMGQYGHVVASARNTAYSTWASSATGTVPTSTAAPNVTSTATATSAPVASCTATNVPTDTYDYIIVGAGAGGIPLADKLSEAGKSVLLIERALLPPGRWVEGDMPFTNWRPSWLDGTNLTRFDVPGLCNQIWVDSANIACNDIDQMAGCLLGGGTAVNAALWWKAPAVDWDYNFPTGWKSADMQPAVDRVFEVIPGTDHPSKDGKLYYQQGFNVLSNALAAGNWKQVTANESPDSKNKTFAHAPFMYANGERGGPMATYLVNAAARNNFKLVMNTSVRRVVRNGGHVTGVEVQSNGDGGLCGTVNVTASSGRVILSAGTFGSTKILFRSGIGPEEQLKVVNASTVDGDTMIADSQWINLPVGHNLDDHTNTDLQITHKNVSFYDFYGAWKAPIASDEESYMNDRTGILTTSAPNIGPVMWDQITGSDGITRQIQWTARVEGDTNTSMTISQYLGRGSTSRGVLSITSGLTMQVSTVPYLRTDEDKAAVIQGIKNLQAALSKDPNIVFTQPPANTTVEDFVNDMPVTTSKRRANHWMGTAKMGTDSGLVGGTSVVDTNTRVYGTDNLYVVDASIFPGMVATNPSALIVAVAEKAAEKILASEPAEAVQKYYQCGGRNWTGSRHCAEGLTCASYEGNADYMQCI
uniref:Cellobiose dehydrogenase n=1 Tax=Dichomera saubinetii TaxID=311193 RepID=E7D6C1_9PEZI|nr:cellobiose dehydrogenase [Dichomera saubinetii]